MPEITIESDLTDALIDLIEESFRVRPNHDPVFVDINGHMNTIMLAQHQVVFGRRGSGKSCLLVSYHRRAQDFDTLSIYVDVDEYKKLRYPDLLIRLLIDILDSIPHGKRWWLARLVRRKKTPIERHLAHLRGLLAQADVAQVQQEERSTEARSVGLELGRSGASVTGQRREEAALGRTSAFTEQKLDAIERGLSDYKSALTWGLEQSGYRRGALLVDDFYLIPREHQPDVIDYLHRLLRGRSLL